MVRPRRRTQHVETAALSLRELPSVDHLLQAEDAARLIAAFGRTLTLHALNECLDSARLAIHDGGAAPSTEDILRQTRLSLEDSNLPSLIPVINASGVILHTNLGRAPLSRAAMQAAAEVASGYSNLEYDLDAGTRGRREQHVEGLLQRALRAEAALVVNNNAAAVMLALSALARRKEVLVSRSQLIEIGGGFRLPDVMKESGAKLVEVGTTNRTHLPDFESAISDRTALILRVHHSNFKILGFTTEPSLSELVSLGRRHGLPVFDDLGSGALLDTAAFGLGHEPTVQESLQAGASLVAFSGDKLLGGPQAGIIAGEASLIARLRRHPLARALRPDKMCVAALAATLDHYLREEALREIPIWRMIGAEEAAMRARADAWAAALETGEVLTSQSTIGGGSLPEETLPTWVLAIDTPHPNALAGKLRRATPPVIARVDQDRLMLDPRTVLPDQDQALIRAVRTCLAAGD